MEGILFSKIAIEILDMLQLTALFGPAWILIIFKFDLFKKVIC